MEFAPKVPRHPQEQEATSENQADDCYQLVGDERKTNSKDGCCGDPYGDCFAGLPGGQPIRRHPHCDCVVFG